MKYDLIFLLFKNPLLSKKLSNLFSQKIQIIEPNYFADGEFVVKIKKIIKNQKVLIIQSGYPEPTKKLFEQLIFADTLKRNSVNSIDLFYLYLPFSRQDRQKE